MKIWLVWTGTAPDVDLDGVYTDEAAANARVEEIKATSGAAWDAWTHETETK